MNDKFEVDASKVLAMLNEFSKNERKQVFRSATRNALNIVKKQALQNLRSVIAPNEINKKDKWGNSFRNGITIKVKRNNKEGVIHIMKNFKMKFFEMGTKQRYTKTWRGKPLRKKRFTGTIKASHFFTNSIKTKESEVFASIDKLLTQSIVRINNKHK